MLADAPREPAWDVGGRESPWLEGRNHIHPAVHRVQDAIAADPSRAWTLAALARIANTSARHLSRLFNEHAGMGLPEYINRLRVSLARELIGQTRLDMERVAERSGFGSARSAPTRVAPLVRDAAARIARGFTQQMTEKRVQFDFEVDFSNGGGLSGRAFRLDIDGDDIADAALADYIVRDLRLLMVGAVRIRNKTIIAEPHKRSVADATEHCASSISAIRSKTA